MGWIALATVLSAVGCSGDDDSSSDGASGAANTGGRDGSSSGSGGRIDEPPVVLQSNAKDCGLEGGELGEGVALEPCREVSVPGYDFVHCIKAHPDCATPGTDCPVYITGGVGDAYFNRVEQPQRYGRFMVVRLDAEAWEPRNAEERLHVSALIDLIRAEYPGHDPDSFYFVAFSNPSDTLSAVASGSRGEGGTSLDGAFAAFVKMGYCANEPEAGAYPAHWLTIAGGDDDTHAGDGSCVSLDPGKPDALRLWAELNGCDGGGEWADVDATEPYFGGANGSGVVKKRTFGNCSQADILHYRFMDERHTAEFDTHFAPPLSGVQIAWNFLQGRKRPSAGGVQGLESPCTFPSDDGGAGASAGAGGK